MLQREDARTFHCFSLTALASRHNASWNSVNDNAPPEEDGCAVTARPLAASSKHSSSLSALKYPGQMSNASAKAIHPLSVR